MRLNVFRQIFSRVTKRCLHLICEENLSIFANIILRRVLCILSSARSVFVGRLFCFSKMRYIFFSSLGENPMKNQLTIEQCWFHICRYVFLHFTFLLFSACLEIQQNIFVFVFHWMHTIKCFTFRHAFSRFRRITEKLNFKLKYEFMLGERFYSFCLCHRSYNFVCVICCCFSYFLCYFFIYFRRSRHLLSHQKYSTLGKFFRKKKFCWKVFSQNWCSVSHLCFGEERQILIQNVTLVTLRHKSFDFHSSGHGECKREREKWKLNFLMMKITFFFFSTFSRPHKANKLHDFFLFITLSRFVTGAAYYFCQINFILLWIFIPFLFFSILLLIEFSTY